MFLIYIKTIILPFCHFSLLSLASSLPGREHHKRDICIFIPSQSVATCFIPSRAFATFFIPSRGRGREEGSSCQGEHQRWPQFFQPHLDISILIYIFLEKKSYLDWIYFFKRIFIWIYVLEWNIIQTICHLQLWM